MFRHSFVASALALVAFVGLPACSSDDNPPTSDSMHREMPGGMREHADNSDVTAGAQRIEVQATSFTFDPQRLTVPAGEPLEIVLTSIDILHDFEIVGQAGHVTADGGETASGGFRLDTPGEYEFECTVAGHRAAGMVGTIVATASSG